MTSRIEPLPCGAIGPISLLHRACFPEDPWDAGAIEQIMGIPGFFGRVGWAKTAPVGFALALALREEAEIVSLGVLPSHRRCGIGSAILDAVCGEARLRGAEWRRTTKRRAHYTQREVLLSSGIVGITTVEQNGWWMRSYCECKCQQPRYHLEFAYPILRVGFLGFTTDVLEGARV